MYIDETFKNALDADTIPFLCVRVCVCLHSERQGYIVFSLALCHYNDFYFCTRVQHCGNGLCI